MPNRELLAELVRIFAEDLPKQLGEIQATLGIGDAERLRFWAHTLKGSVGLFKANTAYALAQQLETMGRERRLAGAEARLAALTKELDRLLPALRRFVEDG